MCVFVVQRTKKKFFCIYVTPAIILVSYLIFCLFILCVLYSVSKKSFDKMKWKNSISISISISLTLFDWKFSFLRWQKKILFAHLVTFLYVVTWIQLSMKTKQKKILKKFFRFNSHLHLCFNWWWSIWSILIWLDHHHHHHHNIDCLTFIRP